MLEPDLSVHPVLRTERLVLRPFNAGDVEALHRLRSDERTMAFVGRPRSTTVADAAALIQRMELDRRQGDGIGWAMQQMRFWGGKLDYDNVKPRKKG